MISFERESLNLPHMMGRIVLQPELARNSEVWSFDSQPDQSTFMEHARAQVGVELVEQEGERVDHHRIPRRYKDSSSVIG
jgi:hypothetical protein